MYLEMESKTEVQNENNVKNTTDGQNTKR